MGIIFITHVTYEASISQKENVDGTLRSAVSGDQTCHLLRSSVGKRSVFSGHLSRDMCGQGACLRSGWLSPERGPCVPEPTRQVSSSRREPRVRSHALGVPTSQGNGMGVNPKTQQPLRAPLACPAGRWIPPAVIRTRLGPGCPQACGLSRLLTEHFERSMPKNTITWCQTSAHFSAEFS